MKNFLLSKALMLIPALGAMVAPEFTNLEMGRRNGQMKKEIAELRKLTDSGACTFEAVVAGDCILEDYCTTLYGQFEGTRYENGTIECSGTPDTSMSISYIMDSEVCWANVPPDEETLEPIDITDYDPEAMFCTLESYTEFFGPGGVFELYHDNTTFTRPAEGTFGGIQRMYACDEGDAGFNETEYNGIFYCEVLCPDSVEVNGIPCKNPCVECPNVDKDNWVDFDCSNLDPALASDCIDDDNHFDLKMIDYFAGLDGNTTEPPTQAPAVPGETTAPAPNGTTDAPTVPPTSGIAPRVRGIVYSLFTLFIAMIM